MTGDHNQSSEDHSPMSMSGVFFLNSTAGNVLISLENASPDTFPGQLLKQQPVVKRPTAIHGAALAPAFSWVNCQE